MVVDDFTKWVEVKVIVSITPAKIKEFVYKNIVYRYGVPHTIISNNGTQFDYNKFKDLYNNLQIKKVFLSVVRPQANGQVKAVNKMIKHKLKTKLKNLKGRWAEDILEVLWAYWTTPRSTTGATPFKLGARSLRRDNFDPEQNMILQQRKLHFLK